MPPFGMATEKDAVISFYLCDKEVGYGRIQYGLNQLGYGGGELNSSLIRVRIGVWVAGVEVNSYVIERSEFEATKIMTWTYTVSMNKADNGGIFRSALAFKIQTISNLGVLSNPSWIACNTP